MDIFVSGIEWIKMLGIEWFLVRNILSSPDITQNSSSSMSQASLTDAWKSWNDVVPAVFDLVDSLGSRFGLGLWSTSFFCDMT